MGDNDKDFLWLNIRELPYFRGLLRAVEARFYQDFDIVSPALDLGCGDGHFASITFDRPLDVGLDPWMQPLLSAAKTTAYHTVLRGDGANMPFPDAYFSTLISNSVLEHIPGVDAVLVDTCRVLKPGGYFYFCVLNHHFTNNLSISSFLERLGLKKWAESYRKLFNRISRHHHCDSPEIWQKRLEQAGFILNQYCHYFSPAALHVLEWGHYLGLPSWIIKKLTGKWILVPKPWNLILVDKMIRRYYVQPAEHEKGSYTFYIAQKLK